MEYHSTCVIYTSEDGDEVDMRVVEITLREGG